MGSSSFCGLCGLRTAPPLQENRNRERKRSDLSFSTGYAESAEWQAARNGEAVAGTQNPQKHEAGQPTKANRHCPGKPGLFQVVSGTTRNKPEQVDRPLFGGVP